MCKLQIEANVECVVSFSTMFDMLFYASVIGYHTYLRLLKQNPNKIICNGSKQTVKEYLFKTEEKLSIVFKCNFFNYYMKIYFKYFNLKFLNDNNK